MFKGYRKGLADFFTSPIAYVASLSGVGVGLAQYLNQASQTTRDVYGAITVASFACLLLQIYLFEK